MCPERTLEAVARPERFERPTPRFVICFQGLHDFRWPTFVYATHWFPKVLTTVECDTTRLDSISRAYVELTRRAGLPGSPRSAVKTVKAESLQAVQVGQLSVMAKG